MGWVNPAILLTQMKYMFIFAAYAHFDTPEYKSEHPEVWRFFTNDPSSMGFSSVMNLTVLFLLLVGVVASIGAQISQAMIYFRVVLIFFQFYTVCCLWGTISMLKSFGLWEQSGGLNVYVAQFVVTWVVLCCPFFLKPLDAMQNLGSYCAGLPAYYLSFFWWYVIITVYSMCNLDDVTWGNRPSNASKGLNVVVDDAKRQEILRQNYRTTRTHILIWWLMANVSLMYTFDALVLSAVHNGNLATKVSCQALIKGYAWYCLINSIVVLGLSAIHTFTGFLKPLLCGGSYQPVTIRPRPPVSSDPETKVLLDDTEEEEAYIPPVVQQKKKMAAKAGKSDLGTEEDASFFSDDLESHQFLQQYK